MPMHDWTRVEAGIFHAFHHRWISAISDALNAGLLPGDLYALPEQIASKYGPDVLTLRGDRPDAGGVASPRVLQPRPVNKVTSQADAEFYRRKKSSIVVRHVSGDEAIALIEIVSPGNKSGRKPTAAFVDKAWEFLNAGIHLLLIDPFPPGPRDPGGVHGLIWEDGTDGPYRLPPDKPLTLVAYEAGDLVRAYVEPVAVGDALPDVPLFLEPNGCVMVPVEATYRTAFDVLPRRWRDVLQPPTK